MTADELPISAEDVLVRTQLTPNPYALKFVVNMPLKRDGKATFGSPVEAEGLPLVYNLFLIDGVKQVHLFQNTVTVTHTGELETGDLAEQVIAVIKSRLPVHDAGFGEPQKAAAPHADRGHLSPEMQKIEEILDRTIRPGLQADGGDIEAIEFVNNRLKILYQGACGGCPSSMMGTLDAIQGILRQEMDNPEIEVVPV
jgi:NFU1 iron-sulfur cluster scaffold homolog, mitochondrial